MSKVSRKNRGQECKNLTGLKFFVFGDLNYGISFRLRFVRHVFANKVVVYCHLEVLKAAADFIDYDRTVQAQAERPARRT